MTHLFSEHDLIPVKYGQQLDPEGGLPSLKQNFTCKVICQQLLLGYPQFIHVPCFSAHSMRSNDPPGGV